MRRIRLPAGKLSRLLRRKGVGAGVLVTAATAGAIFAYVFRGAPLPEGVTTPGPVPLVIDLLAAWDVHQIAPGVNGAGNVDGADGVYLADVDGDLLPDVVSGHEQGLRVTLSFNPGSDSVESPWPTVTLPTVNMCSVEDAILCDVDLDGALDVVAACETGTNLVEVMFAPAPPNTRSELLVASNWTRVQLTASAGRRSMRAACANFDTTTSAIELIVGGKDANGVASSIGYYSSATPRTGGSWTYTSLFPVGWVMDMAVLDFNADGDLDIVYVDKVSIDDPAPDGSKRGVRWLDSNGTSPPTTATLTERQIVLETDHKWGTPYDWDADGDLDWVDCRSSTVINLANVYINGGGGLSWSTVSVPVPAGVGQCQEATVVDADNDGKPDIALSYSNAQNLSSVVWLKQSGTALLLDMARGEISGLLDVDSDVKFDNLEWYDLDGDGDKDAIASEQHIPAGNGPGLGVVWFENPLGPADQGVGGTPDASVPDAAVGGGGPIACVSLTSGTGTASTTAVTASVAPGANRVVYAAFMSALAAGPAAPASVTGNGLTWVQEDTIAFHTSSARRLTVFRALGGSPSAGAITASWGAVSQTSFIWSIIECDGANTTGTSGSGATVQSVTNTATAAGTITTTLAALAATSSVHLSFTALSVSSTLTSPDADFVELTDNNLATGVSTLESQWATNQTAVTPTFATANAGVISVEVRAP